MVAQWSRNGAAGPSKPLQAYETTSTLRHHRRCFEDIALDVLEDIALEDIALDVPHLNA